LMTVALRVMMIRVLDLAADLAADLAVDLTMTIMIITQARGRLDLEVIMIQALVLVQDLEVGLGRAVAQIPQTMKKKMVITRDLGNSNLDRDQGTVQEMKMVQETRVQDQDQRTNMTNLGALLKAVEKEQIVQKMI